MNAASCRLTGIDAHLVVGKPVSSLLSIPAFSVDNGDIVDGVNNETSTHATTNTTTVKAAFEPDSGSGTPVNVSQPVACALDDNESLMTIDRLIMTCGCDGDMHLVNVRTKSLHPSIDSEEQNKMLCRLAIAPIVVSKNAVDGSTTYYHDHSKRARYHDNQVGSQDTSHLQQQELTFPLITHFVIQFEMYDNEQYGDSMESLSSSNSIDEQVIDTHSNKHGDINYPTHVAHPSEAKTGQSGDNNVDSNLDHDQSNVEGTDIDGSISVQSSDREPIVAIG